MLAEIITIGDEILIGQTIDTNSAWLGKELNQRGVDIERITSIRDTPNAITKAIDEAKSRAELILLTGGLGPTNDDVTKNTLADYFGAELIQNEEALANIEQRLERLGISVLPANREQALLPANCQAIPNSRGTAPGMLFEVDGKRIVSMPGVPYEMKAMMTETVLPLLEEEIQDLHIVHQTITVVNVPESRLSHQLEAFEASLPQHIKLAYLPHLNLVRLRLSARSENVAVNLLEAELEKQMASIKEIIGPVWFEGDKKMAEVIGSMLLDRKATLGTIESCTGGYISHSITIIPGSSAYFQGSYVTYSNQYKMDLLGVDSPLFTTVGSVSEEVAFQMAQKGQKKLAVDYCIAVTGIAGPSGATDIKPVGLVYIALASPDGSIDVSKHQFKGSRAQIIERTAYTALEKLRKTLL